MSSPYPDPSQTNIDAAFSNAEALFNQRRFDEALGIYQNVLAALETRHGPSHPELAYPLQRLGDCHHALNQFRDSLPLYQRLLTIGDKILGLSHPDMLNLMLKIARTQEMIGSFQESRKTYETLLPIIEASRGANDPLFKSSREGYELIIARIDENKRAADAWRESSQSGKQEAVQAISENSGIPIPGVAQEPGFPHSINSIDSQNQGMNIEVPDRAADPAAFEMAGKGNANSSHGSFGPFPGSGTFGAGGLPPSPPTAPPQPPPPVPSSAPPQVASAPQIPGTFPGSSQRQAPPAPPSMPAMPPSSPPPGPSSNYPAAGQAPFPPAGSNVPVDSGNLPSVPPGVVPPQSFENSPPPWAQQPASPQAIPEQSPEHMQQVPVNSVGPIPAIPGEDAMYSEDLGFESRKSDPSNDPYLDHLASRVTSLTPPDKLPPDPIKMSGAWHGADVIASFDKSVGKDKSSEDSYRDMEDEEFDPDYEDEETQVEERSQKLRAARTAASKSEGIVSIVRSFKEYLISGLALLIVGVAGYFFFTHTEQKGPALVPKAIESTASLAKEAHSYVTPDRGRRLTLDGSGSCTLHHDALGIKVPYNFYDSNPSTMALQSVDSLLERQHWFKEIPEGLEDEQGVVLYSSQSPDFKVLQELEKMKQTVSIWYQRTGSYPSELVKIPKGVFAYTNPFTSVKEEMKINFVRFSQIQGRTLQEMVKTGQSITGDGALEKGRIIGYIQMENETGSNNMKAVAFYMRAVNRHGQFFTSSKPGEKLFVGFKGGVDDGNDITFKEQPRLYRVDKPTKVWISKLPQVPLPLIHRSLPIVLGFLGFFLFLRSLMLAPGQSPDNNANKTFRLCGWVLIILTIVVVALQFMLWR